MELLFDLISNTIKLFFAFRYLFIIAFALYIIKYIPFVIKYYKSNYKKESGVGLFKFLFNIGYFGEGLTYMELEKIPLYSRILVNLYIPKEEGTTELDLVYLTESGIYVIESKNYSGWIYGNSKQKEWTQSLYGRKYKFLNPIWQNNLHIKYLKEILPDVNLKSLIVFSERCTLKKVYADEKLVVKRSNIRKRILEDKDNKALSKEEIDEIYNTLKVYGNKSEKEKRAHIDNIKENYLMNNINDFQLKYPNGILVNYDKRITYRSSTGNVESFHNEINYPFIQQYQKGIRPKTTLFIIKDNKVYLLHRIDSENPLSNYKKEDVSNKFNDFFYKDIVFNKKGLKPITFSDIKFLKIED